MVNPWISSLTGKVQLSFWQEEIFLKWQRTDLQNKEVEKEKNKILLETAALHVLSPMKVTEKGGESLHRRPSRHGARAISSGSVPPKPSSVPLQITQRCPSHQSQWEDTFWSQTESIANKSSCLCSAGAEEGGVNKEGWEVEDGLKHTPVLSNQNLIGLKCCPVDQQRATTG